MRFHLLAGALALLIGCDSTTLNQPVLEDPISSETLALALADRGVSDSALGPDRAITFNENADIFTDQTPAESGVNGVGRTVGRQRLNAALVATMIVEEQLRITQEIQIEFQTRDFGCGTFAVGTYNRSLSNGPNLIPDTVYPTALSNQLIQQDTSGPDNADILILLNENILNNLCPRTYNYSPFVDRRSFNSIDFVELMLHEISHGLGFELSPPSQELPFIYERLLFAQDKGSSFAELSSEEKADSASQVKNIVFTGPLTTEMSSQLLRDRRSLSFSSNNRNFNINVNEAVGSPFVPRRGIRAPLVNLDFNTCLPQGDLAGSIVVLPSGCAREELGLNGPRLGGIQIAERDGALAAVVGTGPTSFRLTGFTPLNIPVVSVRADEFQIISQSASTGTTARLSVDRRTSAGANNQGQPYVFTGPNVPRGINIIHYDPSVSVRNSTRVSRALQEFVVSQSGNEPLRRGLGFNLPALIDMGWAARSCGNSQVEAFEQCDDGNTISGDACEQNCLLPQ